MEQPRFAAENPCVRIMIVAAFCLVLAPMNATLAGAAPAASPADTLAPVVKPEPVPASSRALAGTHTFTTDEMSEAYDPVFVGSIEFFRVKKGFMLGFEIGWTSGKGTPPLVDSDWVVTHSSVKMWALLLEPKIHYNFLDDTGSELFGPYVAAGPGMWVGGERLTAEATRTSGSTEEAFRTEQWAMRLSFGVSAMVGTTVRITGNFKALIEVRYVLGTSGSMLDLVDEEDKDLIDATLYSAVQRPGFNFTGWQISWGLQF